MSKDVKTSETSVSVPEKRYGLLGSLAAVILLAGCSSVPDAVNPVEWYRGTVEAFSGDDDAEERTEASTDEAVPGEDDEFPNLASVPERPAANANVGEGLVADPNAPKYADSIQLQGEDDSVEAPAAAVIPTEPTIQEASVLPSAPEPEKAPEQPAIASTSVNSTAMANVEISPPSSRTNTAPLVIQPGKLPSGETYEEYRTRLMKGLDSSGSAAIRPTTGYASSASFDDDIGTIVISSDGVNQGTPNDTGFGVIANGISDAGFRRISRDGRLVGASSRKVATIHFNNGSDELDTNDVYVLRQVAALQQQNGGVIRVIGHASSRTRNMDPVRHKLVNYRMSSERADAVASALVRLGLPKDAIVVGAASDSEPVYREVMPTGEAGNRRAEIYIDS